MLYEIFYDEFLAFLNYKTGRRTPHQEIPVSPVPFLIAAFLSETRG
jgi:hypothetical protein